MVTRFGPSRVSPFPLFAVLVAGGAWAELACSRGAGGQGGAGSGGAGSGASGGTSGEGGGAGEGVGGAAGMGMGPGTGGSAAGTGGTGPATGTGGQAGGQGPLDGDVTFTTPSQSFKDTLAVGMQTAIAGAEVRYTVDGTLPAATSTVYDGTPLTLTATTQLRAQPFVAGAAAGKVATALYIARTFDLESKLPIVLLDDYGQGPSTDKDEYLDAAVMIFEPAGGVASVANLPTIAARAGFHLRGQSSSNFPQKPYKIELRDNADDDAKYAVLGMAADADWALIAPYYDRALLRNPFTYTLGRDMGMQAPHSVNAEVYINFDAAPVESGDYQGIYWLTETIKINNHRTALAKLAATDVAEPGVSGGYIIKFDQAATDRDAPHITCTAKDGVTCWTDCELVDPVPLPAESEQLAWLTAYVQGFHETLFTTPLGNYGAYIDVPSFVDNLIINELSRNVDAYLRSSYYYKDRDAPLRGGPLWDYNFALGVGSQTTISPIPTTNDGGWQYQGLTPGSVPRRNVNSWYPRLMTDPAFVDAVKARWAALRATLLADAAIDERIATLAAALDPDAVARDFAKWPVSAVLPEGRSGIVRGPSVPTWEEQVKAMRDFVLARAAWLDTQWLPVP